MKATGWIDRGTRDQQEPVQHHAGRHGAGPAWLMCLVVPLMAAAVLGCGVEPTNPHADGAAGALARMKPLMKNCSGPTNGYFALDFSGTGRDAELLKARLQALQDMSDQVAACGGFLKVIGFAASAADTVTLGEKELPTTFGTENARLIKAGKTIEELMEEVKDQLPAALKETNAGATDVLAQFELARQYQQQRGTGTLFVGVASDGIATARPIRMNTPAFTEAVARVAAERVRVPDLAGARVHFHGLGKTAGDKEPSTERIAALKTFYDVYCARTRAACLVTTDYTKGG